MQLGDPRGLSAQIIECQRAVLSRVMGCPHDKGFLPKDPVVLQPNKRIACVP